MAVPLRNFLRLSGVGSRRRCDQLIKEGLVEVNGKVCLEPWFLVDEAKDVVLFKGKRVRPSQARVYIMMNKPRGVLTSTEDPLGRPTVLDLVRTKKKGLFPVGRLDYDAEGLLLLTNDGDASFKLTHPKFGVPRGYLVKVKGKPGRSTIHDMKLGAKMREGFLRPLKLYLEKEGKANSWFYIEVSVGWNRVVKNFFEGFGYPVIRLVRVKFGPLKLFGVPKGGYRHLTKEEVSRLKRFLSSLS